MVAAVVVVVVVVVHKSQKKGRLRNKLLSWLRSYLYNNCQETLKQIQNSDATKKPALYREHEEHKWYSAMAINWLTTNWELSTDAPHASN